MNYSTKQQRQYNSLFKHRTDKSKQSVCTAGGLASVRCSGCNDTWKCEGRRKHTNEGTMTCMQRQKPVGPDNITECHPSHVICCRTAEHLFTSMPCSCCQVKFEQRLLRYLCAVLYLLKITTTQLGLNSSP